MVIRYDAILTFFPGVPTGGGGGGTTPAANDFLYDCPSTVNVRDFVYQTTTTNRVDKACSAAAATMPAVGAVLSKPTATTCWVRRSGEVPGYSGLTPGSRYQVSKTTPGAITLAANTRPAENQTVGRAKTSGILTLMIAPDTTGLST